MNRLSTEDAFDVDLQTMLRRPLETVCLRAMGAMPDATMPRVAVIGARRATPAQLALARTLARALCEAGAVVVSGGALGIDAAAHEGALTCGGRTIAVLPCGLGRPSPARHLPLYQRIAGSRGLLLSAFADQTAATRASFHQRNSLIAHLVDALITVCADTRSGSLHCTARARRAGAPIFAVPWSPGTANSEGSNDILAKWGRALWSEAGAEALVQGIVAGTLTTSVDSPELPRSARPKRPRQRPVSGAERADTIDVERRGRQTCAPLDPPRRRAFEPPPGSDSGLVTALDAVLTADEAVGITLEEAARLLDEPRGDVAAALLALGMSGQVRRGVGGRYRRCP